MMFPLVTTLTLLTASPMLPLVDELQHVELTGLKTFEIRSMPREVSLAPVADAATRAKHWSKRGLCPAARADGHTLILSCTANRLHVRLDEKGASIFRVRGLPWEASDEPSPSDFYAPETIGLGGPCPGTTPAGQAECALKDGKWEEGTALLNAALKTVLVDYARLRLGDVALHNDDPLAAIEWYQRVPSGVWGRLAAERECTLTGTCTTLPWLYDTASMAAPLRDELVLRKVRNLHFASPAAALELLAQLGGGTYPTGLCERAHTLCLNVLKSGLQVEDPDTRTLALTMYSSGPVGRPDPRRPELADAAATAAISLGAPRYAGAVLATAAADVPREQLFVYLRRVAGLYLQAGETARAAAVYDYCFDTFGAELKRDTEWKRIAGRLHSKPAVAATAPEQKPIEPDFNGLTRDLADATLARARLTLQEKP